MNDEHPELKRQIYRSLVVCEVFLALGFNIAKKSEDLIFLEFPNVGTVADVMLENEDMGLLYVEIQLILERIGLPRVFFDGLYDTREAIKNN